ncbi:MAG: hypothetical protein ACLVB1_04270 [Blautia obeum]
MRKNERSEERRKQGLYRLNLSMTTVVSGSCQYQSKTHDTVANAFKIVEHLEHRAGKDAEGKTGDGVVSFSDFP